MISIIIPTLNEEQCIGKLLSFLKNHNQREEFEVIVVDGASQDNTATICNSFSIRIIKSAETSRAHQMNEGAKLAKGEIFYFVHADAIPPKSFVDDIFNTTSSGYESGCYRFEFLNKPTPLLYINDFCTRFPFKWCRGGDQTLFISRKLFDQLGGFNEKFVIMEDYEMLDRIMDLSTFKVMPKPVLVSSRKYSHNSYMKVQLTNLKAMRMYRKGVEPAQIKQFYQSQLNS